MGLDEKKPWEGNTLAISECSAKYFIPETVGTW